ncbi:hypothetical protein ACHAWF_007958, partial [Thalassiosira exigua]
PAEVRTEPHPEGSAAARVQAPRPSPHRRSTLSKRGTRTASGTNAGEGASGENGDGRAEGRRKCSGNPNHDHDRTGANFDYMFDRLSWYKAQHGDCKVTKSKTDDAKLFHWVRNLQSHCTALIKKGIEHEEAPRSGRRVSNKTLTIECVARLEELGFQWSVQGPKTSLEDRFRDCVEYFEANGRWPSQSMLGQMGEWVHKQRTMYAKNDRVYMKAKAPLLDSVGFEWTPQGNTRMSWDEGFTMLMAFRNEHGHFNVPCPPPEFEKEGKPLDSHKSDACRLYNWVESLHGMY